jgi:hypothetical protein
MAGFHPLRSLASDLVANPYDTATLQRVACAFAT